MKKTAECAHARPSTSTKLPSDDARFQAVLQSMPDAVIVSDANGRIVLLNGTAEMLFGYTSEQLIGRDVATLIPHRFRATHSQRRNEYLASPAFRKIGKPADLFAVRADGTEFPVSVSLGYFDGEYGRLVIASVRDQTELRERDRSIAKLNDRLLKDIEKLGALNAELEAFSYSISHDLRAPLRTIDGIIHLLQEDPAVSLNQTGRKYINTIGRAAERMGSLIDDLLKLARISRGEIERTQVDLSAQANDVLGVLRATAPRRNVECRIAVGVMAHGDSGLLHIVLENLLSNAFKFTKAQSPARIEFGQEIVGGRPAYFVRDNGVGFNMAYADKLFGPFQRLHDVREFPGNGIGLAIVQRVIDKHGGQIWAQAAPDEGASFYFTV